MAPAPLSNRHRRSATSPPAAALTGWGWAGGSELGGRRPGRWLREAGLAAARPPRRLPRARSFPRPRDAASGSGSGSPRPPWASPAASLRPEDKARVCSSGGRCAPPGHACLCGCFKRTARPEERTSHAQPQKY